MKRRAIKQGYNTLTISLPRKWCKDQTIKAGEEIEMNEKGSLLILSREPYKESKEVTVDITGLNKSTVVLLIQGLYTYGHDYINIKTKDTKTTHYIKGEELSVAGVIQDAMNRLIGAEVINSSKGYYKIEIITEESKDKFEIVLRRIFRLTIEMFESYIEGKRTNNPEIIAEIPPFRHINIQKFKNYALRILNKVGYEDTNKTTYYFAILNFLSKIDEIIKNFAKYDSWHDVKLDKTSCDMLEEICNGLKAYYETFYKFDIKTIDNIQMKRDLFKKSLYEGKFKKFNNDSIFILSWFTQIYDLMLDLSELRMAIEY